MKVVDVPLQELLSTHLALDVMLLSDIPGVGLCLPLNYPLYPLNEDVLSLPKCARPSRRVLYVDRQLDELIVHLTGWEVHRLASCPANYPLMMERAGVVLGDGGVAAWERASLGIVQLILPSGAPQGLVGNVLSAAAGVGLLHSLEGLQEAVEGVWDRREDIRESSIEMGIGQDIYGIINLMEEKLCTR
jgi:hypothetical protein